MTDRSMKIWLFIGSAEADERIELKLL